MVEEWFYLSFGAAAIGMAALTQRRSAIWVVIAAFIAVPAALRWTLPEGIVQGGDISKIVLLRLDAIAFGVALAVVAVRHARLLPPVVALACAGAIITSLAWASALGSFSLSQTVQRVFFVDFASIGFALCLPAFTRLSDPAQWLATPVRALSAQSYGLYLIHLSCIQAANRVRIVWHLPAGVTCLLAVGAPCVLSWLSWHWFEKPILAHRPSQWTKAPLHKPDTAAHDMPAIP